MTMSTIQHAACTCPVMHPITEDKKRPARTRFSIWLKAKRF